jgi:hypothetical protein
MEKELIPDGYYWVELPNGQGGEQWRIAWCENDIFYLVHVLDAIGHPIAEDIIQYQRIPYPNEDYDTGILQLGLQLNEYKTEPEPKDLNFKDDIL